VTSCIVDNAAIYTMVAKFINTICPPPPQFYFIGGLRCLPIQKEQSRYIADRTRKVVYIRIRNVRQIDTVYCGFLEFRLCNTDDTKGDIAKNTGIMMALNFFNIR
jgi:hypothetical protein